MHGMKCQHVSVQNCIYAYYLLVNISVSTMVLFKCPFAISRNTAKMFKRFQIGENYFGGKEEEKDIFQVCTSDYYN